MKSTVLDQIIDTADQFTNACRTVSEAVKAGIIDRSKGSVGKESIAVTSTIKATHGLDGDKLKGLKLAMDKHNTGHAFQRAYGVTWAHMAEQARVLKGILDLDAGTSSERTASEEASKPASRNGKVAVVTP